MSRSVSLNARIRRWIVFFFFPFSFCKSELSIPTGFSRQDLQASAGLVRCQPVSTKVCIAFANASAACTARHVSQTQQRRIAPTVSLDIILYAYFTAFDASHVRDGHLTLLCPWISGRSFLCRRKCRTVAVGAASGLKLVAS